MRELRLRKLARPLSEARKDPSIDKPALFVERLYGRPLRCDPQLIAITPENREEFIRLVGKDFSHAIVLIPFPHALPEEEKAEYAEKHHTVLGLPDLLTPWKTWKAINEVKRNGYYRVALKIIAGETDIPGKHMKAHGRTQGLSINQLEGNDILVFRPTENNEMLVHELIHAEDFLIFGKVDKPVDRINAEGRAYFGERAYQLCLGEPPGHNEFGYLPYVFNTIFANSFAGARIWIRKRGALTFLRDIRDLIRDAEWRFHTTYYPYMAALVRLTEAVGSPILAFRISTDKLPRTRLQVEMPLTFYKAEIEMARKNIGPQG